MTDFECCRPKHCPLGEGQSEIPQRLDLVEPGQTVDVLPSSGGRIQGVTVEKQIQTEGHQDDRIVVKDGDVELNLSGGTACQLRDS